MSAIRRYFALRPSRRVRSTWAVQPLARVLSAVLIAAVGCSDEDTVTGVATSSNFQRTNSVFALSGTPASLPAGYYFVTETLVRPQLLTNGSLNFEMAFDIGADGRVSLLPARVVVPESPAGSPTIGMQQSTIGYTDIVRAPDRNYVRDSAFTGVAGDSFILQLLNSGCPFGDPFYAKIAIDSVIPSERRIVFTSMVNRNCGFRGLVPGLPTN